MLHPVTAAKARREKRIDEKGQDKKKQEKGQDKIFSPSVAPSFYQEKAFLEVPLSPSRLPTKPH